ncbi:unnamed protein product [Kluyveromyces dobzhanskii CBS 2104]|uniref:WGS project CCBQ000000000 data, contig 00058 n=1 Tax=Kluyveromyces dobzhanskii CBS 2104 TaxID=1427455 RepID=A0A0A8LBC9_9SACH|nr:unnamed protein product [Kluyveromyces dobzhanskii CBS 2104]
MNSTAPFSLEATNVLNRNIFYVINECMKILGKEWNEKVLNSPKVVGAGVGIVFPLILLFIFNEAASSVVQFCWQCFFKPFTSVTHNSNQQQNLEQFYKSQAKFYDRTRRILLQGRETSLKLSLSHLSKRTGNVWIDVGGGTGFNISQMSLLTNLKTTFDKVYLIDLSPSLCEVARKRCKDHGWTNVEVICGDACDFEIQEESAQLITFSYSLSMIPSFYAAIDHAVSLLDTKNGVISCIDFGVTNDAMLVGRTNTLGGLVNRHIPWLFRTFWRLWFEFDKVFLDPARREYLEYRFGTIKSLNCYNFKLGKIPYYIWLGCNKDHEQHLQARFVNLAPVSPYLAPINSSSPNSQPMTKAMVAALENTKKGLPYPSLFYQKEHWRVYYDEVSPEYHQFKNSYIYAFTWEDPEEDVNILNIQPDDTVLAITSAGDNILHYASLPNPPKRIHGVDLNPCQSHLAELKLAALRSLDFSQVWQIFGEGKIDRFENILLTKLAPHLSSNAFQYWFENGTKTFDVNGRGLYDTGFTKWALRLARFIFKAANLTDDIDLLCKAKTLEEQRTIWDEKIKPVLFNRVVGKVLVGNPLFLWSALGVPRNQAKMMGSSTLQYIIDTLDPVINKSLISDDNYFYYLTLKRKYSRDSCPDYLKESGFNMLSQKGEDCALDRIRLHTDTLKDVCERLSKKAVSIAIIMDHMDWFDPSSEDVDLEIKALWLVLNSRGRVMLRSASKSPWYIKNFEKFGFSCKAVSARYPGKCIDRVNMYASTWVCQKISMTAGINNRRLSSLNLEDK